VVVPRFAHTVFHSLCAYPPDMTQLQPGILSTKHETGEWTGKTRNCLLNVQEKFSLTNQGSGLALRVLRTILSTKYVQKPGLGLTFVVARKDAAFLISKFY
jgi:hypothetical protein